MATICFEVSDETHREFKAFCARRGQSMADALRSAIQAMVFYAVLHDEDLVTPKGWADAARQQGGGSA